MEPPPPTGSDTTLGLLRQAQRGDGEALDAVFRRVMPAVRRWARGQVPRQARNLLDTDDLVQETLTRTLAHVKNLETSRARGFYLYLREALRNRIRDELRRVARQPGRDSSPGSEVAADETNPLGHVMALQRRERYERALGRLDPEDRAMVVGRFEFGLGWREIAEVAGRPSGDAARMAVSRALARMATELADDE